jgi:hypothetical protein
MHPTHTGYPQFKCKTNGHIYMDYRQIMMQMQMPWLITSLSLSLFFFQERQIKKMIRIMACVRHCFHMAASLVALLITIENLNRNERSQVTSAPWRRGVLCNFLSAYCIVFHGVADDGHMYGRRARSNFRPGTVAWRVAGRTRGTA